MQLFIGNIQSDYAELNAEESQHFIKVLRGKVGQEIYVTDGQGTLAHARVSFIESKRVELDLLEVKTDYEKRNYRLHIAIAPTKSIDRIEWFLEKATEIGIDEITFLKSFHSERKNINLERCRKIVQSAMKQSLKAYEPKLNDMVKLTDFIENTTAADKFIAHCDTDFERKDYRSIAGKTQDLLILIGPEGDFSKDEIRLANAKGFVGLSLGNQRFRTETAALNAVFGANWGN